VLAPGTKGLATPLGIGSEKVIQAIIGAVIPPEKELEAYIFEA
jgi:hypothetical protein